MLGDELRDLAERPSPRRHTDAISASRQRSRVDQELVAYLDRRLPS
jgi:hypothetical protein